MIYSLGAALRIDGNMYSCYACFWCHYFARAERCAYVSVCFETSPEPTLPDSCSVWPAVQFVIRKSKSRIGIATSQDARRAKHAHSLIMNFAINACMGNQHVEIPCVARILKTSKTCISMKIHEVIKLQTRKRHLRSVECFTRYLEKIGKSLCM